MNLLNKIVVLNNMFLLNNLYDSEMNVALGGA